MEVMQIMMEMIKPEAGLETQQYHMDKAVLYTFSDNDSVLQKVMIICQFETAHGVRKKIVLTLDTRLMTHERERVAALQRCFTNVGASATRAGKLPMTNRERVNSGTINGTIVRDKMWQSEHEEKKRTILKVTKPVPAVDQAKSSTQKREKIASANIGKKAKG